MADKHHHRLTERNEMEMRIRCPNFGTHTSFGDILAAGACHGGQKGCRMGLRLDLVVVE